MRKSVFTLVLLAGTALALPAAAQGTANPQSDQAQPAPAQSGKMMQGKTMQGHMMKGHMMGADADKNGVITKEEFMAHRAEMYKKADVKGDGKVTKEEFIAFLNKEREQRRQMMEDRMFKKLDTGNKGYITKDEFMAAGEKMFDRMDPQKTGKISRRHGNPPAADTEEGGAAE